tara:strand:- start:75696 stop:80135 length:4440 start_codon:yes stop_codon:yes gene_type:complete
MKLFYRSLVILSLAILGFSQNAKATHITGGDISYQCVGTDSFLITLNLYRDCAGVGLGTTATVNFTSSCGGSASLSLTQIRTGEISQLCPTQIPNSTCNGGTWPGMEEHVYQGIVVLSPPCNSWTMAWSSCCRNNQVTNLTNPGSLGTYLYTTMFSQVDSCNNSPVFTASPIPYVCKNQVVNYNFGVVEPDGDSIVYYMAPGQTSATATVPYVTGYTYLQPTPGNNAVLNSTNGQLTFTPTSLGVYVIVIRIEEYDRATGVVKATSIRDIQVVVQNCTNLQPKFDSGGIYNFSSTTGSRIDSNTVDICIGDSFSFDVSITDPDTLQTLSLYHNVYRALDSNATVTLTNGNPAVFHISWLVPAGSPPFKSFNLTAIDDACPVVGLVSGAFNIIINPATYAGIDVDICKGTQWADLHVVGGTSFLWTVISGSPIDTNAISPNFNMTCRNCANPSVSPQTTTVYAVTSNLVGVCKHIDTITVTVNQNFTLNMPNDTIICPIDSIVLYPNTVSSPSMTYTYSWRPSATVDFDTLANPTAHPLAPTTYRLTATSSSGCVKEGDVFVDLSPQFPPGAKVYGDTVICLGDSTQLELVLGQIPTAYCGPSTSPCVGNNLSGIIGTGNLTNTNYSFPAPYNNSSSGVRHQILYTAAELHAMGMPSGKIGAIYFDVATIGQTRIFNNFEVKIGCTTATDLQSGWETGLTTVRPGYAHRINSGWNKHEFTTDYDWDGSSNIVIEICYTNTNSNPAGTGYTRYTATPNRMVRYTRGNNSNICSGGGYSYTTNNRPNIKFDFCTGANPAGFVYSWTASPTTGTISDPNIVNPNVSPITVTTYTVIVQDTFLTCSDTVTHTVDVVSQFDASFNLLDTICINGGEHVANPNVGGGVFTGIGIIDSVAGIFSPDTSGTGTFSITYTVSSMSGGCQSDSSFDVTVIPLTDASFAPKEFCLGDGPDTLISVLPNGVWHGAGIIDTINGIFDPAGQSAGLYPITHTLYIPCLSIDTQFVKIVEPYSFSFTNPIVNVCEGNTKNLTSNYTLSGDPNQGSGPVVFEWSDSDGNIDSAGVFDASALAPGDYVVALSVAGLDGTCGTSQTMIVRVQAISYASAATDLTYCSDEDAAVIPINPWLFGTGVTYTQTPIAPLTATDTLTINQFGQFGQFDARQKGKGQWAIEMTFVNTYGCVGVSYDTITVNLTPDAPVVDETTYCEGDDISLSATVDTPDSLFWYRNSRLTDLIGSGNDMSWGPAPNPAQGDKYIWVTQNNGICVSTPTKYKLPIKPSPVAEFQMAYTDTTETDQVGVPHTQAPIYAYTPFLVSFSALNTTATDTIVWHFHREDVNAGSNTINTSNNANVNFNYATANIDVDGSEIQPVFIARLLVTNEFGCFDSANAEIYSIATEALFNVFTPNGDGINDIFYLPVFGLNDYKVEIFNRWGKQVYSWEDPTQGWNGEKQPDGVYFYVVTGTKNDSNHTPYKKQGTVTLTGSGN